MNLLQSLDIASAFKVGGATLLASLTIGGWVVGVESRLDNTPTREEVTRRAGQVDVRLERIEARQERTLEILEEVRESTDRIEERLDAEIRQD